AAGAQSAPSRRSQAGSAGPSASRTRPAPGGPAASSSSPKTTTAARGARRTSSTSYPQEAANPITPGVTGAPAGSSSSPARASSPVSRQSRRSGIGPSTVLSRTVQFSTRSTWSVPGGTIAPVAISTAVPSL